MSTIIKEQEDIQLLEQEAQQHRIVLHNDDFNTFDFVIESLMEVCEHDLHQAEQCTMLVHYKGKCEVKTGDLDDLKPRCSELLKRGLSAELV
ncbi:MAG: ATP-dependent Clp protease adaptor ClpS [Flavobacteriales bacterium]